MQVWRESKTRQAVEAVEVFQVRKSMGEQMSELFHKCPLILDQRGRRFICGCCGYWEPTLTLRPESGAPEDAVQEAARFVTAHKCKDGTVHLSHNAEKEPRK